MQTFACLWTSHRWLGLEAHVPHSGLSFGVTQSLVASLDLWTDA
jgi:hypothetical protein